MRALVVYESMYGNTHEVAAAVGDGLREFGEVAVVPVHEAEASAVATADLVVVGGPTHAHGMSRGSTRAAAAEAVTEPDTDLTLDPDAAGDGVREWLESLDQVSVRAAAFDTRVDMSPLLTGRASKGIAKQLERHGCELVADAESFLVTKATHLEPDEHERARAWGQRLGTLMAAG